MEIQNHCVETEKSGVSDYFLQNEVRQSQTKESWDKLVVAALSVANSIDPFQADIPEGTVISALEAKCWSLGRNCDIRPRLHDKSSGIDRLVDSGSQISVTRKGPNDKIDHSLKLVAVNGTKIDTYGVKTLQIKIGRKTYPTPAVICDIDQDILGMDFLDKFKLNFEWDEVDQSELYLVDKKSTN